MGLDSIRNSDPYRTWRFNVGLCGSIRDSVPCGTWRFNMGFGSLYMGLAGSIWDFAVLCGTRFLVVLGASIWDLVPYGTWR